MQVDIHHLVRGYVLAEDDELNFFFSISIQSVDSASNDAAELRQRLGSTTFMSILNDKLEQSSDFSLLGEYVLKPLDGGFDTSIQVKGLLLNVNDVQ